MSLCKEGGGWHSFIFTGYTHMAQPGALEIQSQSLYYNFLSWKVFLQGSGAKGISLLIQRLLIFTVFRLREPYA